MKHSIVLIHIISYTVTINAKHIAHSNDLREPSFNGFKFFQLRTQLIAELHCPPSFIYSVSPFPCSSTNDNHTLIRKYYMLHVTNIAIYIEKKNNGKMCLCIMWVANISMRYNAMFRICRICNNKRQYSKPLPLSINDAPHHTVADNNQFMNDV